METALLVVALLAAGALLVYGPGGTDRRPLLLTLAILVAAVVAWTAREPAVETRLQESLPEPVTEGGFVSSDTCRSCHPGEYHSWHRSFHRTMTRPATPENVRGDFTVGALSDRGHTTRFERRGDEFWVEMNDPAWFVVPVDRRGDARPEQVRRMWLQVVMTTGSHHMQTYWVRKPADGGPADPETSGLLQVPWVWLVAARRWVPTQDSFLTPPRAEPMQLTPWITSCNMCHSVGTQPHLDQESGRSAELGIACEACHGPGAEHVRANRSPLRRYLRHQGAAETRDETIVNPARLDKVRSAEVCGQCHSFNKELDMARWARTGVAYRAGAVLGETKAVFKYTENPTHPRLLRHLQAEPTALQGRFWKDGTIRTAGREYNGLIESKCYTDGEMTCLSCHSMHDYQAPKDLLARKTNHAGGRGHQQDDGQDDGQDDRQGYQEDDRFCLQCHGDFAADVEKHTFHRAGSDGSRCVNCHMPHTTFGLLGAMRSHRIDSPSAANTARTGRPNACNLCHLDRSLEWTSKQMAKWYGHPEPELTAAQRRYAAGVLWAIAGDGAQRAITAWALGWESARQASGRHWQAAFLADLLLDPYSVVREVAHRSLGSTPGFDGFVFDYVAPLEQRIAASKDAVRRWRQVSRPQLDRHGPHLLLDARGRFDVEAHGRLLQTRDNTPVSIIE